MSEAEARLWVYLRDMPFKFRRQEPIGPYVTDFCCYEARLVVEVDGDQHMETKPYDARRDEALTRMGFSTIRVTSADVLTHITAVTDLIAAVARNRTRARAGTDDR